MTVFIFSGPTLPEDQARATLPAIYLPPAAQGDVYRAARHRPRAIGIIDGYFEHVPSVWHKEILWAMSHGIHVFGGASMGALRAAELTTFGMVGVGWVFEQYRDGILEDDDEVAVAHGPAESGYRAQSEAMVNIRRTLARAAANGVLSVATHSALERIAKELFYPERIFPAILHQGQAEGLPLAELEALQAWLPDERVDQKRDDALAMLSTIDTFLSSELGAKRVQYHFENTHVWDYACREAGELRLADAPAENILIEPVLDELRLDPDAYARSRQAALLRYAALALAHQKGDVPTLDFTADTELRQRLADNDVDRDELERLIRDEMRLHEVERIAEREIVVYLTDHLRLSGDYARLRSRALDKRRRLQAVGWEHPSLAAAGLTEAELISQYFEQRLGLPVPADCDAYSAQLGFPDRTAFVRTLLSEHIYERLSATDHSSTPA